MKTTSFELSKALKEAGANQDNSEWMWREWINEWDDKGLKSSLWERKRFTLPVKDQEWIYDSFDCHELLERLRFDIGGHYLHCQFCPNHFIVGFRDIQEFSCSPDTPTKALSKLYLWCLQNGHIKE